jgi:Sulfotransferase family
MSGPVFILGSQGSGSTLLRLMLDSHERIAIPQETGFMRLVTAHRRVPFWQFGDQWYGRLGLTEADLDEQLRSFYGGMFERYAAQRGKVRWGDKTPFHVWHASEMARLFPDAMFIAIVRHPLGAIGSLVRRFDRSVSRATRHWLTANARLMHTGAELGDRLVLLRYEDLALEPESTMRELLEWLGEPWSENVLRHHEVQREQGAPVIVDGQTRSTDAVDASRVDRWRRWFNDTDRRSIEARTRPLAEALGYTMKTAVPVTRLSPAGDRWRFLLSGTGVDALRTSHPEAVPARPPRTPWTDRPLVRRGRRRRTVATPQSPMSAHARVLATEQLPPSLLRWWRRHRHGRSG